MDIYIEYTGLKKTEKILKICNGLCDNTQKLNIHLILAKKLSLPEITILLNKHKIIGSLEILTSIDKVSNYLIKFINSSSKVGIVLCVHNKLNKKEFDKISKIRGIIRIIDTTRDENQTLYHTNRYIIYKSKSNDGIKQADIYNLVSKEKPIYQCSFSSCLGRTLYISKNEKVSFCPIYISKSEIGVLTDIQNVFNNDIFLKVLENNISKRANCKKNCEYFDKCKGGCPLEEGCINFPEEYQHAKLDLEGIEHKEERLSNLPFYKEYALLNKLLTQVRK